MIFSTPSIKFLVKIPLTNDSLFYNYIFSLSVGYSFATYERYCPCSIMDSVKSYLLPYFIYYFYILPNILFTIDYSVCFFKNLSLTLIVFYYLNLYIYKKYAERHISGNPAVFYAVICRLHAGG